MINLWMSFATEQGNVGVILVEVEATTEPEIQTEALMLVREINPGGEVKFFIVPDEYWEAYKKHGMLLCHKYTNLQEIEAFQCED